MDASQQRLLVLVKYWLLCEILEVVCCIFDPLVITLFLGVTQILSVGEVVEIAVVMKPVSVVAEAYLSFEFEDLYWQQDQVQASQQENVVAVVIYSSDPASFQFEEQRDRCPQKKD